MSDRAQIIQTIEAAYAARVRGDLDAVMQAFTHDASFRLNAPPDKPATVLHQFAEDGSALRRAMSELIDNFEFLDLKIVDCIVDGSKAGVHSTLTVRAKSTGKEMRTELFDLVEFKDGKISSFTQFFDTASAMALLQAPARESAAVTA